MSEYYGQIKSSDLSMPQTSRNVSVQYLEQYDKKQEIQIHSQKQSNLFKESDHSQLQMLSKKNYSNDYSIVWDHSVNEKLKQSNVGSTLQTQNSPKNQDDSCDNEEDKKNNEKDYILINHSNPANLEKNNISDVLVNETSKYTVNYSKYKVNSEDIVLPVSKGIINMQTRVDEIRENTTVMDEISNAKIQKIKQKLKETIREQQIRIVFMKIFDNLPSQKIQILEQRHYDQVKDCVILFQENHTVVSEIFRQKLCRSCSEIGKLMKKFQFINVCDPQGLIVFCVDLFAILEMLIWMYIYSLYIFFEFKLKSDFIILLLVISIGFSIFEIFFRMNQGFYQMGHLVINRNKIFMRYMKGYFIFDLIGLAAQLYTNIIANQQSSGENYEKYSILLYFIKMVPLAEKLNKLENQLYLKGIKNHYIQLTKMFLQIVVICHSIGSIFYWISNIELRRGTEHTWIMENNLEGKNISLKYLESFYWALAVLMLIGTKGFNFNETLFTSITLILTVGVFGYIISKISQILENIEKDDNEYKKVLYIINQYMSKKQIQAESLQQVRSYLEYLHNDQKDLNLDRAAKEAFEKFPDYLKKEITKEINSFVLQKFPFIKNNFSKKTIDKLLYYIEEQTFMTSENIFSQGQIDDLSLYFVSQGQIELTYTRDHQYLSAEFPLAVIKEGDFIGNYSFLSGQAYEFTANSLTFTTVYKISREKFLSVIKEQNYDFEKFHMIQYQIIYDNYSRYYDSKCQMCDKENHFLQDCSLLSYRPNSKFLCLKHSHTFIQNRNKHVEKVTKEEKKFSYSGLMHDISDVGVHYNRQRQRFRRNYQLFIPEDVNQFQQKVRNKTFFQEYQHELEQQYTSKNLQLNMYTEEDFQTYDYDDDDDEDYENYNQYDTNTEQELYSEFKTKKTIQTNVNQMSDQKEVDNSIMNVSVQEMLQNNIQKNINFGKNDTIQEELIPKKEEENGSSNLETPQVDIQFFKNQEQYDQSMNRNNINPNNSNNSQSHNSTNYNNNKNNNNLISSPKIRHAQNKLSTTPSNNSSVIKNKEISKKAIDSSLQIEENIKMQKRLSQISKQQQQQQQSFEILSNNNQYKKDFSQKQIQFDTTDNSFMLSNLQQPVLTKNQISNNFNIENYPTSSQQPIAYNLQRVQSKQKLTQAERLRRKSIQQKPILSKSIYDRHQTIIQRRMTLVQPFADSQFNYYETEEYKQYRDFDMQKNFKIFLTHNNLRRIFEYYVLLKKKILKKSMYQGGSKQGGGMGQSMRQLNQQKKCTKFQQKSRMSRSKSKYQ